MLFNCTIIAEGVRLQRKRRQVRKACADQIIRNLCLNCPANGLTCSVCTVLWAVRFAHWMHNKAGSVVWSLRFAVSVASVGGASHPILFFFKHYKDIFLGTLIKTLFPISSIPVLHSSPSFITFSFGLSCFWICFLKKNYSAA